MKRIGGAMAVLASGAAVALAVAGCGSSAVKTVTVTQTAGPATTPRTISAPASTAATSPTPSSTTQTTPVAPTSTQATASTPTPPPAPTKTVSLRSFRSPSGNLGCEMFTFGGGGARCDIAKRAWSAPPKPSSCRLDYGQGVEVDGSSHGRFTCAGDTALNPGGKPLPYGEASTVGPFTCVSAITGMTCTNGNSRHGFFIAAGSYRLF